MKLDPKLQAQLGQMFAAPAGESELTGTLMLVDVAKLQTAAQPRQNFDEAALRDLENSIRELQAAGKGIGGTGLLQPLLVRTGDDGYTVTAGERRLRAAKAAGLRQVPVVVDASDHEEAWEQAITENLLRADLSPLEEAAALQKLMQTRGYSVREAAKRLGKDKGYLENRLFLLKAPDDVQAMVSARTDTVRHAREIARLSNPAQRAKLIEAAINGAPFAAIRDRVQTHLQEASPSTGDKATGGTKTKDAATSRHSPTLPADDLKTAQNALAVAVKDLKTAAKNLPKTAATRREFRRHLEKQLAELQRLATLYGE